MPVSVSRAVTARRSVRAFLPKAVSADLLSRLVVQAGRAASGGNLQPWHVDLVTGDARARLAATMRARLAAGGVEKPAYGIYPDPLAPPYADRRRALGEQLYAALGIDRADRAGRQAQFARNFDGFGAPALAFISVDRAMGAPQWSDLGGFLATFMLLLVEAGLGGCAQEAWALWPETLGEFLDLPAERILFCGIAIGWPDNDHPVNHWTSERADPAEWLRIHD